ncbi:MAG: [FeFe] hydrogenase H-cluster maturation GTPase HydF [Bacteroidales bacterium]|nr:[FeFe] hydrogenase H-cluster maturation GTPase HydF [Bacteroidales bacterium]
MKKGNDSKPHIGIFGRRNTGKSTLINLLTGQNVAIVSEIPGTTTDPVKKSIEIFGIGPAVVIDTAGIDDIGEIGEKRVKKTKEVLKIIDLAVLMISNNNFDKFEENLILELENWNVPYFIIYNKSDIEAISDNCSQKIKKYAKKDVLSFSSKGSANTQMIIERMKETIPRTIFRKKSLLGHVIKKNEHVLLVTPIDNEAPEGRMILPQVMAIRDVLDNDCVNIVLKETQLEHYLNTCSIKPKIVITDSQAFSYVKSVVPENIMLTGFSVLFAYFKGNFEAYLKGTQKLDTLKDNDRVLMLESCTHQVNCDDIGRYKIPNWIKKHTNKNINFDVVSGLNKVERDIEDYSLIIQCGGCMVTKKQLTNRLKPAVDKQIPVTNYGMTIAWLNGIFERTTAPFKEIFND